MRSRLIPALTLLAALALPAFAHAQVVVPWSARATVDTDGDFTPDVFDNAPGLANNQADLDNDGIGDVIDPTPSNSNPYLGDPGLGLGGPYTITAGSHVLVDYLMMFATPPGGYGHIDLDLGGDGIYDAIYFGPLTGSYSVIDIPPSLYTSPLWDLNTPGTYVLHAKAYAPGMVSQFDSIVDPITVVAPEPASLSLLAVAPLLLRRRQARSV